MVALERGHEDVALPSLEAEADPSAGQVPALVQAACTDTTRVVAWLLSRGANADERAIAIEHALGDMDLSEFARAERNIEP